MTTTLPSATIQTPGITHPIPSLPGPSRERSETPLSSSSSSLIGFEGLDGSSSSTLSNMTVTSVKEEAPEPAPEDLGLEDILDRIARRKGLVAPMPEDLTPAFIEKHGDERRAYSSLLKTHCLNVLNAFLNAYVVMLSKNHAGVEKWTRDRILRQPGFPTSEQLTPAFQEYLVNAGVPEEFEEDKDGLDRSSLAMVCETTATDGFSKWDPRIIQGRLLGGRNSRNTVNPLGHLPVDQPLPTVQEVRAMFPDRGLRTCERYLEKARADRGEVAA